MKLALLALIGPIVQGVPDDGDPAAVAIVERRAGCDEVPRVICSGVLIAPRVVLTAAHCTESLARGTPHEVFLGDRVGDVGGEWRVVSAFAVHPQWQHETRHAGLAFDVALLRLAERVDVPPVALPDVMLDGTAAGAPARVVGFGVTAPKQTDPDGVKRHATMRVAAVTLIEFTATADPGMSCQADSGGPVFVTLGGREQLLGITVAGDAACASESRNQRVDVVIDDFIAPFLAETDATPEGWSPDAIAPDAICSTPCETDDDCPALLSCVRAPGAQPTCQLGVAPAGNFGASCSSDDECASGESCARFWSHGGDACRCLTPCTTIDPGGAGGCCQAGGRRGNVWGGVVLALLFVAFKIWSIYKF